MIDGGEGTGTRDLLIRGTLRSLRVRGVAGTTSRAIARESGVNLAGITYHFGSKDDLVAQAMIQAIHEWLDPAMEVLRGDGDPVARMVGAIQTLRSSLERAGGDLPVVVEALAQASRSATVRTAATALFQELIGFLADQMEQLKGSGFLPAWIDPPAMATLLVAIGEGVALHSVVDPERMDHGAVAGQMIQLLLSARAQLGSAGS